MSGRAKSLGARASLLARGCVLTVAALSGALLAPIACIIAEPQAELPRVPQVRPRIARGLSVPPVGAVLRTWPAKLVVPVELIDPSTPFQWRVYVDYDESTGDGYVNGDTSSAEPGSLDGGIRVIEVQVPEPLDATRCHTIELLVALRFRGDFGSEGRSAHTPEEPGGDTVSWLYAPSGTLDGCAEVDAAALVADAASVEAGPP